MPSLVSAPESAGTVACSSDWLLLHIFQEFFRVLANHRHVAVMYVQANVVASVAMGLVLGCTLLQLRLARGRKSTVSTTHHRRCRIIFENNFRSGSIAHCVCLCFYFVFVVGTMKILVARTMAKTSSLSQVAVVA